MRQLYKQEIDWPSKYMFPGKNIIVNDMREAVCTAEQRQLNAAVESMREYLGEQGIDLDNIAIFGEKRINPRGASETFNPPPSGLLVVVNGSAEALFAVNAALSNKVGLFQTHTAREVVVGVNRWNSILKFEYNRNRYRQHLGALDELDRTSGTLPDIINAARKNFDTTDMSPEEVQEFIDSIRAETERMKSLLDLSRTKWLGPGMIHSWNIDELTIKPQ